MSNNRFRGFTLIELLVVIAIIGILSAVVLASLNTARQKGADAAVKSNLATVQTQAQLYYDDNSNKFASTDATGCTAGMFGDPTIAAAITSANSSSIDSSNTTCAVSDGGQNFAVAIQMNNTSSGGTQYWCVDATGAETVLTTAPTLSASANGAKCP